MAVIENQVVAYQPNETVWLDVRRENALQAQESPLQGIFYQTLAALLGAGGLLEKQVDYSKNFVGTCGLLLIRYVCLTAGRWMW